MKISFATSQQVERFKRNRRMMLAIGSRVGITLVLGLLWAPFIRGEPNALAAVVLQAPAASAPSTTPVRIVLWNTHNFKYKDRGTKRCNVTLYDGPKIAWSKKDVEIPWKPEGASSITLDAQVVQADRCRVDITECHGRSGGLAEIEVYINDQNVARSQPVTTDGHYNGGGIAPGNVNDGLTEDAGDGKGYWLHDRTTGWIAVSLAQKL